MNGRDVQAKPLTFFARLRLHIQSEREPKRRAAALYLLLNNPAIVRAAADFAQGSITSAQLTDAVVQDLGPVGRKFAVSADDVSSLLQKHSKAAFSKY